MGVGGRVPSGALRLTRKAAEEDSNSNELSEKALGMAIDQIVQKALPDYNALGVVAISNIEIKGCFPTVHEGEGVIQGALTLNVSAKGYKYME